MGKCTHKTWMLHKASKSLCHPVFNLWFTLPSVVLNKNRSIAVLLPCHGWENCSFHFLLTAFSEGVFYSLFPAVELLVHRWDARVKPPTVHSDNVHKVKHSLMHGSQTKSCVQQQCLYSELLLHASLILGRLLNSEHSLIDFFILVFI